MKTLKKLIIPREKWGKDLLLDHDTGKMCCLGHLAVAYGISKNTLDGFQMPEDRDFGSSDYPKGFRQYLDDFGACDLASKINDDDDMSGPEKERRLKILFNSRRITLSFTGKGKP